MQSLPGGFVDIVERKDGVLLDAWLAALKPVAVGAGQGAGVDWAEHARALLDLLRVTAAGGVPDLDAESAGPLRRFLERLSQDLATMGVTTTQTATFIFSLKKPLFERLRSELANEPVRLAAETWLASEVVDRLGLFTFSSFQQAREEVIRRQQDEMLELSTPVVKLWDGVLALPMIGTLDSARTQLVMESLLQRIVESGAEIAIIDITGVPTVDTLVAQHLIKTVTAIRLMGAECIVSGIRPQIAQTIVHLGIDLTGITTKATLADALSLALNQTGFVVSRPQR